ncbi:MAG: phosphoglycerate mutase, 2,3-bisphosphoglycerate-independent [Solirubrobacterales bacterium]|nr:phosphoglycerate mutase, 2,3-bisphosphoglycerate-independent [Solirubrobacterales bacterium]
MSASGGAGELPPGPAAVPVPRAALIILDGWGLAEPGPGNAISLARTPVFDELWRGYPHGTLTTWGRAVGLPDGQMGNSEVGHLNLGAGAVVRQDLMRIDDAIADGELAGNEVLREAFSGARRVHLLGLVSDGGVHSSFEHLQALIALGREVGAGDVVVHAFTDGRDTLPHSGAAFLAELDAIDGARVGSVVGRYWAMDRDSRWERTARAYELIVAGRAEQRADSGEQAVRDAYERGETDEFIEPTMVGAEARIGPGDSVLCFNFRPDRMRQLVRALAEPGFGEGPDAEQLPGWPGRAGAEPVGRLSTLTRYEEGWPYPVAFAPEHPASTLAEVLAAAGARQLHVAETEKYPHVTYFFNGGDEAPQQGERREMVPSPRDVPTYDRKPQMSAEQAADAFIGAWREEADGGFRFGIINFANADMVGHTGVIEAAVKAVETVDACLARIVEAVQESGGALLITADHGNADEMLEDDGSPDTAHSLNPVPVVVTVEGLELRDEGILADVAPTILELLGIPQPPEMTGESLIAGG